MVCNSAKSSDNMQFVYPFLVGWIEWILEHLSVQIDKLNPKALSTLELNRTNGIECGRYDNGIAFYCRMIS